MILNLKLFTRVVDIGMRKIGWKGGTSIGVLFVLVAIIIFIIEKPVVQIEDLQYPPALKSKLRGDGYILMPSPRSDWGAGTIIQFSRDDSGKVNSKSVRYLGRLSDQSCGYLEDGKEVVKARSSDEPSYQLTDRLTASGNAIQRFAVDFGASAVLEREYSINFPEIRREHLEILRLRAWEIQNSEKVKECIGTLSRDDVAVITNLFRVDRGTITFDGKISANATAADNAETDFSRSGTGTLTIDAPMYYGYKGVIKIDGGFQNLPIDDMLGTVATTIYYSDGDTNLPAWGMEQLERIRPTLLNVSEREDLSVIIAGFDDALGSMQEAQYLSEKRAEGVASALRDAGIIDNKMIVGGYGEYSKVFPGEEDNSTVFSRRVDVRVVRNLLPKSIYIDGEFE